MRKGECQWCLELCDLLLTIGVNAEAARLQKAVALTKLAAYETSANGRHYYLVCAHELENRHSEKNGIVEKRITECRNPLKEALIRKEGGLSH